MLHSIINPYGCHGFHEVIERLSMIERDINEIKQNTEVIDCVEVPDVYYTFRKQNIDFIDIDYGLGVYALLGYDRMNNRGVVLLSCNREFDIIHELPKDITYRRILFIGHSFLIMGNDNNNAYIYQTKCFCKFKLVLKIEESIINDCMYDNINRKIFVVGKDNRTYTYGVTKDGVDITIQCVYGLMYSSHADDLGHWDNYSLRNSGGQEKTKNFAFCVLDTICKSSHGYVVTGHYEVNYGSGDNRLDTHNRLTGCNHISQSINGDEWNWYLPEQFWGVGTDGGNYKYSIVRTCYNDGGNVMIYKNGRIVSSHTTTQAEEVSIDNQLTGTNITDGIVLTDDMVLISGNKLLHISGPYSNWKVLWQDSNENTNFMRIKRLNNNLFILGNGTLAFRDLHVLKRFTSSEYELLLTEYPLFTTFTNTDKGFEWSPNQILCIGGWDEETNDDTKIYKRVI